MGEMITVTIEGSAGEGKTLIAAILERALQENSLVKVVKTNRDPDVGKYDQFTLSELGHRANACLRSEVVIHERGHPRHLHSGS